MQKRRFSILLASTALASLLTIAPAFSARAADVSYGPGYQTEAALNYTEEERAELRASAANLHLSETNLNFKCGDILRIYVEPVELAKAKGWEIDKIEFSDPSALRVLPIDDPEAQSKKQELADAIIASDITNSGDIDEDLLVVYLKAEKDGQSSISVSVKNPAIGALVKMVCYADTPGYVPPMSNTSSSSSNSGSRTSVTVNPDTQTGSDTNNNGTDNQTPSDNPGEQPDVTGPSHPTNPEEPTNPEGPTDPSNPSDPDQPENPDTPDIPDVPENPDDGEPKDYDTSAWQWDENTLVFTYDGQPHSPTLLGVGDDVELTLSEAGVNAGKYTYTVSVKTPEGFNPIPDFTVNYEIQPAVPEIEYVYNSETGEAEVQLKNVVPGDIAVNSVTKTPDGNETAVSGPGLHQITATFDVDEDKAGNYILPDAPKDEYLNVKNENSWFDFGLSYSERDGQLLLHVTIDDSAIPSYDNADLVTSLTVYYDKDRLNYIGHGSGDWSIPNNGMVNNGQEGTQEITALHEGAEITNSVIVTLKFEYKNPEDNKDLLFYTGTNGDKNDPRGMDQVFFDENKVDYWITYNTGELPSLVVNPEETQIKDVIIENNDLMEDVAVNSGIEDETIKNELETTVREELKDYVENGFELPNSDSNPDPATPVDPSNPDESTPDESTPGLSNPDEGTDETTPESPSPDKSEDPNPDISEGEEVELDSTDADLSNQPGESQPPVGGGDNRPDTASSDDNQFDSSQAATEESTQSVASEATTTPSVSDANNSSNVSEANTTPSVSDTTASSGTDASAASTTSDSGTITSTSSFDQIAEAA